MSYFRNLNYYFNLQQNDPSFSTQTKVYDDLGLEMLEHAFDGYNVCIFAYGQTGAGKSYTMMGRMEPDQKGIIPLMCEDLFNRIEKSADTLECTIEVNYLFYQYL